jgi:serine-type D-Ala-D-Ala carboxypeptidase/endopeptidase
MSRWIIALALVLAPCPAPAQTALPADSAIARMVRERVASGWTPGLVLGVIRPDGSRVVFAAGYGPDRQPLNERSVFEIGSITKAFTGILLADMAARGEVQLEQPVAALLPPGTRVPERNGRPITLLDLATQSSGLPRLPDNMPFGDPANPYADYSDSLLFAFLATHTLQRDVGSQYLYSNLGFGLLGNALARRAGKPYETLIRERVLAPLEMGETRITLTPELRSRVAPGHDGEGKPASMWDIGSLAGAGALRSTAADMLRFLAANINGTSGPLGQALKTAIEPRRPAGSPEMRIGLGWHLVSRRGVEVVWHNGGTGGYRSFAGFDPVRKIGVVVLTNSSNDSDDLGLFLLGSAAELDSARSTTPFAVPESVLQEYVGVYELAPGFSITVTRNGTGLYGQGTGQDRFQMYARNAQEFFLRVVPARIVFQRDAAGKVTSLILYQGGQEMTGKRLSQ